MFFRKKPISNENVDVDIKNYARFAPQKDITTYELALLMEYLLMVKEYYISKSTYDMWVNMDTGLSRHFHIGLEYRKELEKSA